LIQRITETLRGICETSVKIRDDATGGRTSMVFTGRAPRYTARRLRR